MGISFNKADFDNLQNIEAINKKHFDKDKGYAIIEKRADARKFQQPLRKKLKVLKSLLLDEAYFHNRFDIKLSMPNKQTNQFSFGQIRNLVWLSLVPWAELMKIGDKTYGHQRLPQIQVSFRQDKFIIASVWLEGKGCEQKYRDRFFDYLKSNVISKKYVIKFQRKGESEPAFEGHYEKLISNDLTLYRKDRAYSLGIEKILSIEETVNLGEKIFSVINSELQMMIESVFKPCFEFGVEKKIISNRKIDRVKRKGRKKFDIKDAIRKGTEPTTVTRKHREIQNALYEYFTVKEVSPGLVTKLEEDFVDLKIEDSNNNSLILYEIKTDKSALNCIKNGLGQLMFYNLINRKNNWNKIELVIVGLHKMTSEAKEFVKSIKEYIGEDNFRYQRFDDDKKVLSSELKS
jgi:hypothetical protein